LTDEELYRQARRGEMAAFDQLYGRHERPLFGFILRCVGERADAEEIFHDVFLKVMTGAEATFDGALFAAWIYRMARNACSNHRRGTLRGQRAALRLEAVPVEEDDPERRFLLEERATALSRAVERLPLPLGEVFSLRSAGLSYEEIASALGVPIGTVKSRMNSLVTQLKGEIES
jgi:RNA polymerase sigma-70 factor (ECF subfamily)